MVIAGSKCMHMAYTYRTEGILFTLIEKNIISPCIIMLVKSIACIFQHVYHLIANNCKLVYILGSGKKNYRCISI